jgi:hypothetical protein
LTKIDANTPKESAIKYTAPFELNNDATIKATAYKKGFKTSYISTASYKKININYRIKINSEVNKSYTGGGNDALIDGIRGATNWRIGNRWQGFWGNDFEAVLDLKNSQFVNSVSIGALQDTNAWIIFPTETLFYVAGDDLNFKLIATVKAPAEDKDYTTQIKELSANVNTNCKYIKIVAKNYGTLPAWHEGAGGKAHLFFDEITVR